MKYLRIGIASTAIVLFIFGLVATWISRSTVAAIAEELPDIEAIICLGELSDAGSDGQILSTGCASHAQRLFDAVIAYEGAPADDKRLATEALLCFDEAITPDPETILLSPECVDVISDAFERYLDYRTTLLQGTNASVSDSVLKEDVTKLTRSTRFLTWGIITLSVAAPLILVGYWLPMGMRERKLVSLIGTSNLDDWLGRLLYTSAQIQNKELDHLVDRLLKKLQRTYGIVPEGYVGEVVKFDPAKHEPLTGMAKGHLARIIYPGWREHNRTIRKPTVTSAG